jgi:aspartate racemase
MAQNPEKNIIGIVGGMGPVAGVDLASKIISQTIASKDQDHLPFILHSFPGEIGDRSDYILRKKAGDSPDPGNGQGLEHGDGKGSEQGESQGSEPDNLFNPGLAIARILMKLEKAGATVAGIACNSAHAPIIFDRIVSEIQVNKCKIQLLHVVREVAWHIIYNLQGVRKVGIAGTAGTRLSGLYGMLGELGLEVLEVTEDEQKELQSAIYDTEWGIKAAPDGESPRAVRVLADVCRSLRERSADAVVFACTEFPLAYRKPKIEGLPVIDSSLVLARALVRAGDPQRLKPWG